MTRLLRRAALALPALLPAAPARAAWPEPPIRLLVPFPPGSGTDLLARMLAEPLGRSLGQSVATENRPGAIGTVGAEATARAPAASDYPHFGCIRSAPSMMSMRRDQPRHITVLPGGGSRARAR